MAQIIKFLIKYRKAVCFVIPYIFKGIKLAIKYFKKATMKEEQVKKEGIDLIKKLAKLAINTQKEIKEDLKDGEISTGEYLGLTDNLFSLIKQGLNWRELVAQFSDLDTEEGKEMALYLIEIGVGSDKIEIIILHLSSLAQRLYDAYTIDIIPIIDALKK